MLLFRLTIWFNYSIFSLACSIGAKLPGLKIEILLCYILSCKLPFCTGECGFFIYFYLKLSFEISEWISEMDLTLFGLSIRNPFGKYRVFCCWRVICLSIFRCFILFCSSTLNRISFKSKLYSGSAVTLKLVYSLVSLYASLISAASNRVWLRFKLELNEWRALIVCLWFGWSICPI